MTWTKRSHLAAWVLWSSAVAGCGSGRSESASVISDSAGIRIVTNTLSHAEYRPVWAVESIPALVLGRSSEDSVSMLLHPIGAVRLSDGRVVVGDRGSSSLKIFSSTGSLERTVGRQGDGPGEFRYLARIFACGADSVFADDIAHNFFSVVAPDGAVARTFALRTPEAGFPAYEMTCNRQGGFLTSGWGKVSGGQVAYRPNVPVSLAGADGHVRLTLGQFPGTEMMPNRGGAGPRRMGRWLRLAISRDFAWVAPNTTSDVLAFALDGRLQMIVRTSDIVRPVSPADLDWHRQAARDSAQGDRARSAVERDLESMIPPETLPAAQRLLADSEGYLWVQRYPEPGQVQGRWDVYRPDGVFLTAVSLPGSLALTEIGSDYVLGLATGEDGSEWVQLHRLRRSDT